jgi:replicative DNA helicase
MRKFNSQAEVKMLKTLLDGEARLRTELLSKMRPAHFGYGPAQEAFSRIINFIQSGKELPSSIAFVEDPALSTKAKALLAGDKLSAAFSKADADALYDTLEQHRQGRCVLTAVKDASEIMQGEENIEVKEAVSVLERELIAARQETDNSKMLHAGLDSNVGDKVKALVESAKPSLIKTGFDEFDEKTGGFAKGNLVILASNYGGGKSVTGMQLGLNMYYNPAKVGIVSLEMDEDEYMERILSNISGVQHDLIRLRRMEATHKQKVFREWKQFEEFGDANNARLTVFTPPGLSVGELAMQFKPLGLDVIIIDYLNLMDPPKSGVQQWEELGAITRLLKLMATQLGCTVVALTQMSDDMQIKYARAIAEHANFVWMWRYGDTERTSHIIKVVQHKARNAPRYDFYLYENYETMSVRHHSGPAGFGADEEDEDEDLETI